ncbi:MAG: histidine kinase [Flavobacteriaceae bacterium]|nr:histidine kinase [Flavobacteriaceae bacterium]
MYRNKKITFFSHLIVWFVLFSTPFVLAYGQEDVNRVIAHFIVPMVFYAVIFYTNYFVLIDRYLFAKKMIVFVVVNLIMIVLFVYLKDIIENTFFENITRKRPEGDGEGPPVKLLIYVQMLSYVAPLLFSIAIKTTRRWIDTEAERKEAANFKLKSELQHLHYQLQPHFFFNSLNNIYALVDISPDEAKTSIHSLSKLMRYMLYETNVELVSLSKEIDFMTKYIELMKLRVSDKTVVNYDFPSSETGIKVAPLLFISLIENAFKHGVSASKASEITINMNCEGSVINFNIENNNFPKRTDDKSGSGIGLQNLEKRLELLYNGKYSFDTKLIDERFIANLKIEKL